MVTPLIIAMQNKKCTKEDILTFFNVLGEYFIFLEKSGHVLQKEGVGSHTSNAIHMRPVQKLSKADAKSTKYE